MALKEAELYLEKYTRVHIVIASVIGTWLLLKVDEFYQDGDCMLYGFSFIIGQLIDISPYYC